MPKTYRITEIFCSIQGEGQHTGVPVVFVRFSGCNLRCSWCDTNHNRYTEMTTAEIQKFIRSNSGPEYPVVFTGGEPLLQLDMELCDALFTRRLHVETNGTILIQPEIRKNLHWVTCSPKATHTWKLPPEDCNEIKLIYPCADELLGMASNVHCPLKYIQPLWEPDEARRAYNTKLAVRYVMCNPQWKLGVQMHKLIGVQ